MQAITTRYIGPTDRRGSRIIARCDGGSVQHAYDHALSADGNHRQAVLTLCHRLKWSGRLHEGTLPGLGTTRVWVWEDDASGLNVPDQKPAHLEGS